MQPEHLTGFSLIHANEHPVGISRSALGLWNSRWRCLGWRSSRNFQLARDLQGQFAMCGRLQVRFIPLPTCLAQLAWEKLNTKDMNRTTAKLNPDDFLDLATFHRRSGANALKSTLESAGMEVRLKDERNLQRFWFIAPQKASIHVQVRRNAYAVARKVLGKKKKSGAHEAVRCPSCGSPRVQFPALTRKNLLPGLVGCLLAALHVTTHKYYCEDCHFTWPQPKPDSRPRDILQW